MPRGFGGGFKGGFKTPQSTGGGRGNKAMGIKERGPRKKPAGKRKVDKEDEEMELKSPEDMFGGGDDGGEDGGMFGALGSGGVSTILSFKKTLYLGFNF